MTSAFEGQHGTLGDLEPLHPPSRSFQKPRVDRSTDDLQFASGSRWDIKISKYASVCVRTYASVCASVETTWLKGQCVGIKKLFTNIFTSEALQVYKLVSKKM